MRFIRGRFLSVFFLLLFVHSLFTPYYALALTSGPHQPEYTSYEDAHSTDMVNLLTGDFNFNVPILEVPGPEGNFALPLSYHGGIGLEQEASWVGLGFNINAGAILRTINQYPDDASGEDFNVTVQDLTGVNGWNRLFNHPFRDDWNSQTGYHGNVNLLDIVDVHFGNTTSVGVVGVHVGDGGVTFDAVQFSSSLMTVLSYGVGSVATTGASIAKQAAIELAFNTAVSFAIPGNSPSAPTAGAFQYNKTTKTSYDITHNSWLSLALSLPIHSRKKSWHMWLNQTRIEDMYGTLYLGEAPSEFFIGNRVKINGTVSNLNRYPSNKAKGVGSDINFNIDNANDYLNQRTPVTLATDNYVVSAPGISGSISPYRLETGSVALPKDMSYAHHHLATLPYLNTYKVPFIYEGTQSNSYYNHLGGASNVAMPNVHYGLNYNDNTGVHEYNDVTFSSNRIHADNASIKRVPQGNHIEWLTNDEIKSNLATSQQPPRKFIDFLSAIGSNGYTSSDRYKFRSNYALGTNPFTSSFSTYMSTFALQIPVNDTYALAQLQLNSTVKVTVWDVATENFTETSATVTAKSSNSITVSTNTQLQAFIGKEVNLSIVYNTPQLQKGIGGYSITSADGTTYHFALPVYDFDYRSQSVNVTDSKKQSIITRTTPFANTWLLTAITGPDFVDRNSNGLADDGDWGYWVKMNYGKHTDSFDWRIPYSGTLLDPTGKYQSYEQGKKQLYYLNSIETRSHVALFMKSAREDGISADGTSIPLKLDEICLLRKEIYKKLIQAPYNIPDFSNTIAAMCLSSQYAAVSIRDYINRNTNKRIVFNYNYDLCKNTPNASGTINTGKGKLTLKSFSVKGRNDYKIIPDYKFEYGPNPNYNVNAWDGWGMYSSGASHKTDDPSGIYGASWSLVKVSTPLGSDILVNYERDSYGSVSGQRLLGSSVAFNKVNYNTYYSTEVPNMISTSGFAKDDLVRVEGDITYKCSGSSTSTTKHYKGDYKISSVSSTGITLDGDYSGISTCGVGPDQIYITSNNGSVAKIVTKKNGGNLRVGSIIMRDEFGKENKIRYIYTNDDGSSTGVVAQEPEYIRTTSFPFYDLLGYPQTPVMYGKVSVLTGNLATDQDYNTKQVFEFETPNSTSLTISENDQGSSTNPNNPNIKYEKKLFKIENRSAKIGRLISVKVMDKGGIVTSQSKLDYVEDILTDGANKSQGIYTEGTILSEEASNGTGALIVRENRTTVINYPYALKKITNSKDGFSSTSENLNWDFLTGMVTTKLDKSSLGVYIKTVTQPAYKVPIYGEMGSKATNIENRNMLIQNAATYTYLSDASGNNIGLISGEAQTWKHSWQNYRYYNGTDYADEGAQMAPLPWRKGPAYTWRGDYNRLRKIDGTQNFAQTDEYKFDVVNSANWQYQGELLRFDHYGMPLEGVNMNGIYASTKMGHDNRIVIASAVNAKYNEIAFTSCEDLMPSIPFFGGEVRNGSGTIIGTPVHTGTKALSVVSATGSTFAGKGFIFKTSQATLNRVYRASVWTTSTNGAIYYKIGASGSEVLPTQKISSPVDVNGTPWYKIDIFIPKNAVTSSIIEVGVKSKSGTVIFDDFRFQPADATMTCYVYPPLDYEFVTAAPAYSPAYFYTLDNDNLFTKYEYNERGELVKVYNESLRYGVKQVSESKSNYRRFTINP